MGCHSVPIAALAQLTIPPFALRFVYDADFLPPSHLSNLEKLISGHDMKTTNQDVHITMRTLKGFRIQRFNRQLFEYWDLGQSTKNNGVFLIVGPIGRKVKIEADENVFFIIVLSMSGSLFSKGTVAAAHIRPQTTSNTKEATVAVLAVTVPQVAGDALIYL